MKRRWAWIAVLAVGSAILFAAAARRASSWKALISARYPDVRWVDSETLSNWMTRASDEELVLLDVRTPEEQGVSHEVHPFNPFWGLLLRKDLRAEN